MLNMAAVDRHLSLYTLRKLNSKYEAEQLYSYVSRQTGCSIPISYRLLANVSTSSRLEPNRGFRWQPFCEAI